MKKNNKEKNVKKIYIYIENKNMIEKKKKTKKR